MIPRERSINERHPPSTFQWNEFEARLDKSPVRFGRDGERTGRHMKPLPEVSREQAAAASWHLLQALQRLLSEVAMRGLLTDLVVANAWLHGVGVIERASQRSVEPTEKQEN